MARAKKETLTDISEAKKAFTEKAKTKSKTKKATKAPEVATEVTETVNVEPAVAVMEPADEVEVVTTDIAPEEPVANEIAEAELLTAEAVKAKKEAAEIDAVKEQNIELQKQLVELQKQIAAMQTATPATQIIQLATDVEKVQFLWMGEVADDNQMLFGDNGMYGKIIGKTGTFFVPKTDISRVLDGLNRHFLDKRWLIIVDGLNDEERVALGVDYKEGELLDKKAFAKMVDLGDELLEIYPKLCDGHKEMVAKRYYEAWKAKNPNITRERTSELNKMCKASGSENNAFTQILREMNELDIG